MPPAVTDPIAFPPLFRTDPKTGRLIERRYKVDIVSGPDAGRSAVLDGRMVIGSDAGGPLALTDTTISRQHLELTARVDGARVRDLDSKNGTFLAGTRVQQVTVPTEATFLIGKTGVRVSAIDVDAGDSAALTRFGGALGQSPVMQRLFGMLHKVGPTDSTVLLLGETGTGKEVLARAVHERSERGGPFVVFDCGAVPAELIDAELFGHVRGAFTDAKTSREGAVARADRGTLFLDEVGELSLAAQPKLLRVLESGEYRPVGDTRDLRTDLRVVAATHRDLAAEVTAGRFREDLFYRLAVVQVRVPALRERKEDIAPLAHHFVNAQGRGDFTFSRALLDRLEAHPWPGNVRELRNVVERTLTCGDVELDVRPPEGAGPARGVDRPFKEAKDELVEAFTREYLSSLLLGYGDNLTEAARAAGLSRGHLYELLARYGLKEPPR